MAEEQLKQEESLPQWDVALEALVLEEHKKQGRTLHINDFLQLAKLHAIRFDDIMDTMLRMVILGAWQYSDADNQSQTITQEAFDKMYESGRLKDEDLKEYTGDWNPVEL